MRKLLAILVCRLIKFVGGFVGKGTSLPGKYALKICPDILRRIEKPKMIVAWYMYFMMFLFLFSR